MSFVAVLDDSVSVSCVAGTVVAGTVVSGSVVAGSVVAGSVVAGTVVFWPGVTSPPILTSFILLCLPLCLCLPLRLSLLLRLLLRLSLLLRLLLRLCLLCLSLPPPAIGRARYASTDFLAAAPSAASFILVNASFSGLFLSSAGIFAINSVALALISSGFESAGSFINLSHSALKASRSLVISESAAGLAVVSVLAAVSGVALALVLEASVLG